MELQPFRAVRYDATRVNLAEVVAPPYDVISEPHRDALYARNPHNVIRLILNRDPDRYASAARHLYDWLTIGVLRQDDAAALWLYVQNFVHGQTHYERTGLIGAVRLQPFSKGEIRPHERTLSAPKEDRMRLLQACGFNLSPIFGFYATQPAELQQAHTEVRSRKLTTDLTDEFGVRHRIWQIADKAAIERVSATLTGQTIFIADGHHRYETALAYRDQLQTDRALAADDPANFMMMYLCSVDDPGLLVLPTHRILRATTAVKATEFLAAVEADFEVGTYPNSPDGRSQMLNRLATERKRGRLGAVLRGSTVLYELTPRSDPSAPDRISAIDREAPELPAEVRRLDVTILDRVILRHALGIDADSAARAGQLSYSHDPAEVFDSIDSPDESKAASMAFLLGHPDLHEVQAVCLSGATMPQKSTYFYPKLLSGLLFHPLTKDIGELRQRLAQAHAG